MSTIDRMSIIRFAAILALSSSAFLALSCGDPSNNGANTQNTAAQHSANVNANAAGTNVEELGVIINVPYEAEDVAWKQSPDRQNVIAVLRFSPADADRVTADAKAIGPSSNVVVNAESWFPDELIAQSDASGDNSLKGQSYPADRFYLEPFTQGRIIRIDQTDYFVLELHSDQP